MIPGEPWGKYRFGLEAGQHPKRIKAFVKQVQGRGTSVLCRSLTAGDLREKSLGIE